MLCTTVTLPSLYLLNSTKSCIYCFKHIGWNAFIYVIRHAYDSNYIDYLSYYLKITLLFLKSCCQISFPLMENHTADAK